MASNSRYSPECADKNDITNFSTTSNKSDKSEKFQPPSPLNISETSILPRLSPLSMPFVAPFSSMAVNYANFTFPYDVIIAHGPNCKDGATAAWCWWRQLPADYRKALQNQGDFYDHPKIGNKAIGPLCKEDSYADSPAGALRLQRQGFPVVFAFAQPNTEMPIELIKNKRVLILDLDLGDELLPVVVNAAFTMLCDHHTSTPDTVKRLAPQLFGRDKFGMFVDTRKLESGASLSWKLSHSIKLPRFVQIVCVDDTWQFDENPHLHAKEVMRAMHDDNVFTSFPGIEECFNAFQSNYLNYVNRGSILLSHDQRIIKIICRQCDLGTLVMNDGTKYTIAYTQCNVMHSEVGAAMKYYAKKRFPNMRIDLCATWKYVSHRKVVSVSLRDGEPDINLAVVAREVAGTDRQGGGHDTSAAFMFEGLENFHKFIQPYTS